MEGNSEENGNAKQNEVEGFVVDDYDYDDTSSQVHCGEVGAAAGDTGRSPVPFLLKLWDMLHRDEDDIFVSWGCEGKSIVINDTHLFSANVLPKYFKHSNFTSFVSQLNAYGFKKDGWKKCEYKHESFQQGRMDMLHHIKRRDQILKQQESSGNSPWKRVGMLKNAVDELNLDMQEVKRKEKRHQERIGSIEKRMILLETGKNNSLGKRKVSDDLSCSSATPAVVKPETGMEDQNPNMYISLEEMMEMLDWAKGGARIKEMFKSSN